MWDWRWSGPGPSNERRAPRSGLAAPSAKSQERGNEHDHNDQTNEIDQTIQRRLRGGPTPSSIRWRAISSLSSCCVLLTALSRRTESVGYAGAYAGWRGAHEMGRGKCKVPPRCRHYYAAG